MGVADASCMKLLPSGRADLLTYIRTRLEVWQADPSAVGLSPGQVAAIAAQLDEATAAFARTHEMRAAAESATQASNLSLGTLRATTAAALGTIKAFAANQQNAGAPGGGGAVYVSAMIDSPLSPAPLPAPEAVRDPRVSVDAIGRPTITWKPPHPRDARERAASSSGLTYMVQRMRPGEGGFTLVDAGKMTSFTDTPLPAGTTQYMVRAMRGDRAGPWCNAMQVEAGVGGGAVPAMRLAAA